MTSPTDPQVPSHGEEEWFMAALAEYPPDKDKWLLFVNCGFSLDTAKALHKKGLIDVTIQMGMVAARRAASPSAERREEVRKLWPSSFSFPSTLDRPSFWGLIAALDAQSAKRTRAEVEKMRERCLEALAVVGAQEPSDDDDIFAQIEQAIRSLPIESPSR